jgi:hypothetical protein
MATREVLAELAAQFQRQSDCAVLLESAGGVDVAKRVAAGEAADVVVLAAKTIDELIAAGRLSAASRTDIVKSGIAAGGDHQLLHRPQWRLSGGIVRALGHLRADQAAYRAGAARGACGVPGGAGRG